MKMNQPTDSLQGVVPQISTSSSDCVMEIPITPNKGKKGSRMSKRDKQLKIIDKLSSQMKDFMTDIATVNYQELTKLEKKNTDISRDYEKLQSDLHASRESFFQLEKKSKETIDGLKQKMKNMEFSFKKNELEIISVTDELRKSGVALLKAKKRKEGENALLQTKIESVQEECDGFKKTAENLKFDLEELKSSSESRIKEILKEKESVETHLGEQRDMAKDLFYSNKKKEDHIEKLQGEKSKLESELSDCKIELSQRSEECEAVKKENSSLEEELKTLKDEKNSLMKKCKGYKIRKDTLEADIKDLQQELRVLKDDSDEKEIEMKSRVSTCEGENESLRTELSQKTEKIEILEESVKHLEECDKEKEATWSSELKASNDEIAHLQKALQETMRLHLIEKKASDTKHSKELTEFKDKVSSMNKELEERKEKISNMEEHMCHLEKLKVEKNASDTKHSKELTEFKDKLSSMSKDLEEKKETISNLEEHMCQLDELKKRSEEYVKKELEMEEEISGLEKENDSLCNDLLEKEGKIEKLEESVRQLEEKSELHKKEGEETTESVQKLLSTVQTLENKLQEKKSSNKDLCKRYECLKKEMQDTNVTTRELEIQFKNLYEQSQSTEAKLKSELTKAMANESRLKDEVKSLSKESSKYAKARESSLKSMISIRKANDAKIQALEEEVANFESKLKTKDSQVTLLQKQVLRKEEEFSDMKKAMAIIKEVTENGSNNESRNPGDNIVDPTSMANSMRI